MSIPGTADAIINATLPVGDEIWVGGNFEHIGGKTREGFARLSNQNLTNFSDWMEVVALNQQVNTGPEHDPDGDGSPNLAEYAAGTSPLDSGALPEVRYRKNQWGLAMNPEIGDIVRFVEVSDDLVNWRIAEAGEIEIEERDHEFRWRLIGDRSPRYCRVVLQLKAE